MATNTSQPVEETLFVRKASGLVKGWSSFDGSLYAFFAINLFLGIWGFTYAAWIPGGSMFWAIIITTIFVMFGVVVYAGMISAMPRAGGDYVWQSRIFNSPIGFTLAAVAWWFILWFWVPIYGSLVVGAFVDPVARIIGWNGLASFLATKNGVFVASVAVIIVAFVLVAIGMKAYGLMQRWSLVIGGLACLVVMITLAVTSKHGFQSAFDREYLKLYGQKAAYAAILKDPLAAGQPSGIFSGSFWQTLKIVPFMMFWLSSPQWGATLYGEVRGAKEFRKNVYAMGGGFLASVVLGLVFILAIAKTMPYKFFMASQAVQGAYPSKGDWLAPHVMATWIINVPAIQVILIIAMAALILSLWGNVFLSSTRMIFASAFDRVLPEKVAAVSRGGVPWVALLLMAIPAVPISALYAYTSWFARFTYDAVLGLIVTYLITSVALIMMPRRAKRVWDQSAVPKSKIAGIPWMAVVAIIYGAFLAFNLVLYLKDKVYGVNDWKSLIFMGCLYVLALVIWAIAKVVRRRQGMALETVAKEIPFE